MTTAEMFRKHIGKGFFTRAITFHYCGILDEVTDDGKFIHLKDASWVAESGEFGKALKEGFFAETERYPEEGVWVHTDAIVDYNIMDAKHFPMKTKKEADDE